VKRSRKYQSVIFPHQKFLAGNFFTIKNFLPDFFNVRIFFYRGIFLASFFFLKYAAKKIPGFVE